MRTRNLFWGSILILVGLLFLADSLELLGGMDPWKLFFPTLLILLGGTALWSAFQSGGRVDEAVMVPLETAASRARLTLSHAAGRIRIKSGAAAGQLVSGTATAGITHTSQMHDDEQSVKLSIPSRGMLWFMPPFAWSTSPGFTWDLALTDSLPLALKVETGASEANLDLSQLQVSELNVSTGASDTRITLPEAAGKTWAEIECGVASVAIHVPQGVAAQIESSSALSSTSVDTQRFARSGNKYRSPDYDTAANRVDIKIQMGVGSVTIK
jgi:hypothetical protein